MRTSRVNFLTIIRNNLTKAGRAANIEIMELYSENPNIRIMQKRLKNNAIAIQYRDVEEKYGHRETLKIFSQNGVVATKETTSVRSFFGLNKLISITKETFDNMSQSIETLKRSILYNLKNNKIEERAIEYRDNSGMTKLSVYSAGDRRTKFPATKLAHSLNENNAKVHVDIQTGDIEYYEYK